MAITAKEIKDALLNKFKGQKVGYGTWDVEFELRRIIKDLFVREGLDGEKVTTKKTYSRGWTVSAQYKGYGILSVDIKRTKVKSHYSYFGSYADYAYSDFAVCIYDHKDIKDRCAEIDDLEAKKEFAKMADTLRAKEIYEFAKTQFGLNQDEAKKLVAFAAQNYYKIY